MWNTLFFLYSLVVMILSGMASAQLADVSSRTIRYLNDIVLTMSAALSALAVGITIGQSSFACQTRKELTGFDMLSQVLLLIIAIIIEVLLISIVANPEFAALGASSAKNLVITMLALNSVGIAGGVLFTVLHETSSTGSNLFAKYRY